MSLSRDEAEDALRDVERTQRRSTSAFSYRMSWPHQVVWGVVWIVGYGATYLRPAWSDIWPLLALAGSAASFWIGVKTSTTKQRDWRYPISVLAIFVFITAVFLILQPLNDKQVGAFFPILVALYYGLVGIWARAVRILVLGILVAALTLGGFFYLPVHEFNLWMAAVGGGALILGGLWIRSA